MESRQCEFCGHWTPETSHSVQRKVAEFERLPARVGALRTDIEVFSCLNPACRAYHLTFGYATAQVDEIGKLQEEPRPGAALTWRYLKTTWTSLVPESRAKRIPNYVPSSIIDDYTEACRIEHLSPKASATLSRRCLQGIIRDFYGVAKPRLVDEINALQSIVRLDLWEALHSLRSIGNIGAHPEINVNTIIEVEPDEAGELIGLIEMLLMETYVARQEAQERLAKIKAMAATKASAKAVGSSAQPAALPAQSTSKSTGTP